MRRSEDSSESSSASFFCRIMTSTRNLAAEGEIKGGRVRIETGMGVNGEREGEELNLPTTSTGYVAH